MSWDKMRSAVAIASAPTVPLPRRFGPNNHAMLSALTSSGARRTTLPLGSLLVRPVARHSYSARIRPALVPLNSLIQSAAFYPSRRAFQHLAQQPPPQPTPTTSTTPSTPTSSEVKKDEAPKTAKTVGADDKHLTPAEQRRKDWAIIKRLVVNIWPANDWKTRGRVLFGLCLLVGGKVRMVS